MKKTAPIILISLLISQAPSHALYGGPFDNGLVPGQNPDGTYSAVFTGKNLTGLATFGIGSYEGFEGNGRFAVFHDGAVNYGTVSGNADLSSKQVAAALLGVAALPTETTGASATTTSAGQTITVRSSVEGAFIAKISGYPQRLLFSGKGTLSDTSNAAVVLPGSTALNPQFVNLPSQTQTTDQPALTNTFTTTPVAQASVVRSESKFKVRGSRTTTRSYNALNNFASIPPLTPTQPTTGPTTTPSGTP